QPAPGGAMALPWLGFVDPVVDVEPIALDGPDWITTTAYAQDYEEVRRLGSVDSTERTADQAAIARFMAPNAPLMYRNAVCDLLDAEPLGLLPTTRLFARIDAAVATTLIETWRLKFEVGFWRPFEAIAVGAVDGNDGTNPHPTTWVPLIANPAYSDYTSGHAGGTSPFAEVMRQTFGDDTPLVLQLGDVKRSYATLSALEYDALNARIWGGLHFRDAMEDGYHLGHTTAQQVMKAVH
ncbi:MAG TPA: vanadium-dependent haloperoxidase, partial [Ornithinibacter sp.]|nr:vanadium-dependent haloperoxidase [Ornithinibacter sp.]